MIPPQIPKRYAPRLTRCAVLVGLLLSLALVFSPPPRMVQAGQAPGDPQALKTLNQSDDHGHTEGDDHEATPTAEPAHDESDGHHEATPTAEPAHGESDGHHEATPTSVPDDGARNAQPTRPTPTSAPGQAPTQQPHDDSDGHHATPVPADDHSTGGTHSDGGQDESTTDGHGEGEGHSEGEGEGHGRAVPPPDPTTKTIVLSSFAVVNVGVLIVAAVLKRRMPQRTPRPVRPS